MVSRLGAIRIGDVLILYPQEGCRFFFRTVIINIQSLSIDVCAENIMCFISLIWPWHSLQNMRHHLNELPHKDAWIQDAQLRCAPLSCAKRGDLVREPQNAARNCCDATCWLDYFGDQAHSAQRQAVGIMLMTVSPHRADLIISNHD